MSELEQSWVWVPTEAADDSWELVGRGESRPCRWGAGPGKPACGRPSVARLNRGHRGATRWWHYCERHLYGRRVVGGVLWVRVHPDSAAAQRAGVAG